MALTQYDVLEVTSEGEFTGDVGDGRQLWVYVTSVEASSAEAALRQVDPAVAIGDSKVYVVVPQSNVNAFTVGVKIAKDFARTEDLR